jgi:hypothetical protein
VQRSSPVAAGFFVCLQIASEILAFGALFAGVHGRAPRRQFGVGGWQENAPRRHSKVHDVQWLPCNGVMMHPPFCVVKNLFHFRKTHYKGRRKQVAQLNMLFALANLYLADKHGLLA